MKELIYYLYTIKYLYTLAIPQGPDEFKESNVNKDGMKYGLLFSAVIPLILYLSLSGYIASEGLIYISSNNLLNRNVKFGIQVRQPDDIR